MNRPLARSYSLVDRGAAGLACDRDGVFLGAMELVCARPGAKGGGWCEVRSPDELGQILRAAYGPQPDPVVTRLHRGLSRAAAWIEAGEFGRAGVEALMLRLPALTPDAVAKLAVAAALEKGGDAWRNEPRVAAGQAGGGRWTADGGGGGAGASRPGGPGGGGSTARPAGRPRSALSLDDGVYRPGVDKPLLIHTGGVEEEEPPRIGSNGPPDDFTSLQEVFPGLKNEPGLAIPLAPINGFLGVGSLANEANLEGSTLVYKKLYQEIRAVDPSFRDDELEPLADMSWQGRRNLINGLRMQRAAVYYRFRGDVGPLQVETLRFLQDSVDRSYAEGNAKYDAGRLEPRLSREEAIGNYVDRTVRFDLRALFSRYRLTYGTGEKIGLNNRDYDTSGPDRNYTIPDAKIANVSFDWTLTFKTISMRQIRGFFSADSQPSAVIIVRPSQLGENSTYLIPRPATLSPRR